MTVFGFDADLEIGSVFEVAGGAIKITLSRNIRELTKSYSGRVYDVGQIGSLLKMHMGRRLIFASVRLLRLQSDEEAATLAASGVAQPVDVDRRVLEADLLGEGWLRGSGDEFEFRRGISTYPLPLQSVHLVTHSETEALYASVERSEEDGVSNLVPIGQYVGASRVECRANIDRLFGQHAAVLGSTGSGKSSAVAAILHSVIDHQFRRGQVNRPNIVLIDPHGEYAEAFQGKGSVLRAYDAIAARGEGANVSLPYWLLSSEEFRALLIGKTEREATSQANIVFKALAHARMHQAGLVQSAIGEPTAARAAGVHPDTPMRQDGVTEAQLLAFDRDRPRPFKLKEFLAHIENRQARKSNGDPLTAQAEIQKFSSIVDKFHVLTRDARIRFMMQELNEQTPSLADVIAQFISTQETDGPRIKIVDISGLPNEIAGPLTGAIGRLLFQYKVHQTREERQRDPVLLVCEEAHRYVPDRGEAEYEVAQTAIRRIAREGRKYGLGLILVSQRPSDVEGTVISQCNSWIVLRLSNSSDQQHVSRFLPDSVSGMTGLLSSLPRQEALFVGEAAAIPARIKLRTLSRDQLPASHDISFAAGWSSEGTTVATLQGISDRMASDE